MLNNIKELSGEVIICDLFGEPLKREKVKQLYPIPNVDFFVCQKCVGVSNEVGVLCSVRKNGICGVARRGVVISSKE